MDQQIRGARVSSAVFVQFILASRPQHRPHNLTRLEAEATISWQESDNDNGK